LIIILLILKKFIVTELSSEVTVVPPSRLLSLLRQAFKWQQQQRLLPPDTAFDLFRGSAPTTKAEDDAVPTKCYTTIKVNHIVYNLIYNLCLFY